MYKFNEKAKIVLYAAVKDIIQAIRYNTLDLTF